MKKVLLGLALATGLAGAAAAAPIYPVAVVSNDQNGTGAAIASNRSDPTVLFNAYNDGDQFYALGLGGNLVLDFGSLVSGLGTVIEVTFSRLNVYIETMDIFVSTTTTFSDPAVASVVNGGAQGPEGFSFLVNSSFQYVKLVDTSGPIPGETRLDGFDLAEISFSPVPVPAAGFLLAGGLFGLGALRRRAKKA